MKYNSISSHNLPKQYVRFKEHKSIILLCIHTIKSTIPMGTVYFNMAYTCFHNTVIIFENIKFYSIILSEKSSSWDENSFIWNENSFGLSENSLSWSEDNFSLIKNSFGFSEISFTF